MRRHPQPAPMPGQIPAPAQPHKTRQVPVQVATQAALIEPFMVSGGQSWFYDFFVGDPRRNGTQLITSVYVPKGRIGFIKQIRCAPFMPPVFADPWRTVGANQPSWQAFNNAAQDAAIADKQIRPGGQAGLWETPFGWENYCTFVDGGTGHAVPSAGYPRWTWSVRFLQQGVDSLRIQATNLPSDTALEFNVDGQLIAPSAASFYMIPDLAVPTDIVYPGGLPGTAPGIAWGPQRAQALPADPLDCHILVPENTSACLFAQWSQSACPVSGYDANGRITIGPDEYPLLPAFGSLMGYMQSSIAPQTLQNAQLGWGG